MSREAPPSWAEMTTSLTCRDSVEVNTFTNSGISAPARVPQEMIVASFHHCEVSPPSSGIMTAEMKYVNAIETTEVIHTNEVRGTSKLNFAWLLYLAFAIRPLMK